MIFVNLLCDKYVELKLSHNVEENKKVIKVYAQSDLYKDMNYQGKSEISDSDLCYDELSDFEDDENRSVEKIVEITKALKPYQLEPEQKVSEADIDESDTENCEEDGSQEENTVRAGCLNWCLWLKCKVEGQEIDCLCCQELASLNEKIDVERKCYMYHRG